MPSQVESRHQLLIKIGEIELTITTRNTPTAKLILAALPIQSTAQTWGQEIYFAVPVNAMLEEDARDVVQAGEIAFWTEGNCIAIGFGPTPASRGDEIRLATATNIWADTSDDVSHLIRVSSQDSVLIKAHK